MIARRHNQGVSLVEVLLVVTVSALLMAGAAAYLRALRQASALLHARREALQNARVALGRMARQIRVATGVAAISDPTDTAGTITLIDADGVNHVFALVGAELRYGVDSADSPLATGIQSLTFQGYDDAGTVVNDTEPASIAALGIALTATAEDAGATLDLTARARLRHDLVPAGNVRISTTYATAYESTGPKDVVDYWKAFGAPDGDKCHKHSDEAGKFSGFQPAAYTGTVHRMYVGSYVEQKSKDKPLTVTVRHDATTVFEHTFDYYEIQAVEDQWVWQWFDITDGRASWSDADIGSLSIELSNVGDVEAQCFAVRAVFNETEVATWWADREGSGSCPNEWTYGGRALGAPNSTHARGAFDQGDDYQSYRVTVPDSDATILTVEVCVHGGPSWWLTDGTLNVNVALPAADKNAGRRHTLDDDALEPFAPYYNNGGDILTDVSADVDWTWSALSDYEIRLLTRVDHLYGSTRLYADAVGWRVRYADRRRGIVRWSE